MYLSENLAEEKTKIVKRARSGEIEVEEEALGAAAGGDSLSLLKMKELLNKLKILNQRELAWELDFHLASRRAIAKAASLPSFTLGQLELEDLDGTVSTASASQRAIDQADSQLADLR
ncbi:hypothetical protein K1719_002667 [Acacia pycnantha]|nr:hypothetical protein K1719_002667 [Acacia pycnantha]